MEKLKEVVKAVLCGKDNLVATLSLVTVMVIKKKFLDQVQRFFYAPQARKEVKQIPDGIRVVGIFYEGETNYPYLLFTYDDYKHVGKADLWEYACKVVDDKGLSDPEDYKGTEEKVKVTVKGLKKELPQLFTT